MATKYTSVSVTGYNSSPPSDDGSVTEANRITWAKQKTKIGDPIKTALEAIDAKILLLDDTTPNAKTLNYTTTATDHNTTILATSGITITLGDAATMGAGYRVAIKHAASAGIVTVVGAGGNLVNGTSSVILPPQHGAWFECNGGNYFAVGLGQIVTLTQDTSPDITADRIRTYDNSAGYEKWALLSAFAASASVSGVVELATAAETKTGTDTTRAVTPGGLLGNANLAVTGHIYIGPLLLNWTRATSTDSGSLSWDEAFTNLWGIASGFSNGTAGSSLRITSSSTTGVSYDVDTGTVSSTVWFFAWGN